MTSKERITAALSHIQPDRTPIFEYVLLSPIADAILGRKYYNYDETKGNWNERVKEIGWEKAVKNHAHDKIEIALKLGHDLIYATPNPLPPDTSSQNKNENKIIIEYDENDPVEVIKARNIKRKYNIENYCHPKIICEISSKLPFSKDDLNKFDHKKSMASQIVNLLEKKSIDQEIIKNVKNVVKNNNIAIFEKMTEQEWSEMDKNGKLKEFYTGIIDIIKSHRSTQ